MPPGARPRPHRAYAQSDHAYQARTWRISTLYLAAAVRDNGAGRAIATELSAAKARACAVSSSQCGTEAARELGVTFIHIDPTDDYSVEAAAARVRNEYGTWTS
jgi:hypothetical protein